MGYKHTYDTIYTHFQGITNDIYGFGRLFLLLHYFTRPPILIYRSIFVFSRPNAGWTGLYIKLCTHCIKSKFSYTHTHTVVLNNTHTHIIYK